MQVHQAWQGCVHQMYPTKTRLPVMCSPFYVFEPHTCAAGKMAGRCVADHQPPNKMVQLALEERSAARGLHGLLLRLWPGELAQRFYPQCLKCSSVQGASLVGGGKARRALVFHRWLLRQPQVALGGVAIGYINAVMQV
jgi:hypothetical protein